MRRQVSGEQVGHAGRKLHSVVLDILRTSSTSCSV
jgi:hypothetical protein